MVKIELILYLTYIWTNVISEMEFKKIYDFIFTVCTLLTSSYSNTVILFSIMEKHMKLIMVREKIILSYSKAARRRYILE